MKWHVTAHSMVLKVLGVLLVVAAILKAHELLTVPVAGRDLWSWRPFLIFQVEFELAIGIWLLSGVFRRLAWLAALACFSLFCCVTLYKGLTGAASCGCFGTVHISPWITLTTIDLPAMLTLALFRPESVLAPLLSFLRRQESIHAVVKSLLRPMPSLPRVGATAVLCLTILGMTTPILALNKPALITSTYEVLEPMTWIGKAVPILEYIDIGEQLKKGIWLLLFYHHDCPDCQRVIPRYKQMARGLMSHRDSLRIALVEVPPYGPALRHEDSACVYGRLADVKEWFVATPTTILACDAKAQAAWEAKVQNPDIVLRELVQWGPEIRESRVSEQDARSTDVAVCEEE